MAKKKDTRPSGGRNRRRKSRPRRPEVIPLGEIERREAGRLAGYKESNPELTAGDVDADWLRAASVGEEGVGGSVATPDQDRVDEIGKALGVPRSPDEEFRPSGEILESRDRNRWDDEDTPGR
jgi:hypothetical protein